MFFKQLQRLSRDPIGKCGIRPASLRLSTAARPSSRVSAAMQEATKALRSQNVPVYNAGDEDYERSVATSNMLYRFSRPDCVVLPENAAHVQAVVKEARAKKLKITTKCGGHSYAGHSTAFGGISLDLRRMNSVGLDTWTNTVAVEAGCQWGHVYKTLVNGRHNGLMVNGGRCPYVGVSGFLLGGGLGPFTRTLGMGCDGLLEATVVTADGNLVTVKETDDPSSDEGRLFWALRGAGGGNFGIMVNMKLSVKPLQNTDGMVVSGKYSWYPGSDGAMADAVGAMNAFYTTDWPDRVTIDSTWMCDLQDKGGDGVRFLVCYDGSKRRFDKLIDKLVQPPALAEQLKRRSMPEKSTRFLHETLVSQWSEETVRAFPTNKTYSIFSSFVLGNDKATIEKTTAIIREQMVRFRSLYGGEKVKFLVTWIHSGGRAQEKAPSATAFFWREATYHVYVTVEWEDKWMERDMRGFLGAVKGLLRPQALRGEAAFLNFPDGVLPANAYERAYFGGNYEELRRVKEIWDKDAFFKFSQGVRLPQDEEKGDGPVVDGNDEDFTDVVAAEQWDYFDAKEFGAGLAELAKAGY